MGITKGSVSNADSQAPAPEILINYAIGDTLDVVFFYKPLQMIATQVGHT